MGRDENSCDSSLVERRVYGGRPNYKLFDMFRRHRTQHVYLKLSEVRSLFLFLLGAVILTVLFCFY